MADNNKYLLTEEAANDPGDDPFLISLQKHLATQEKKSSLIYADPTDLANEGIQLYKEDPKFFLIIQDVIHYKKINLLYLYLLIVRTFIDFYW